MCCKELVFPWGSNSGVCPVGKNCSLLPFSFFYILVTFSSISLSMFLKFFYWRIIALQCCVAFYYTSLQISHNYIYVYPLPLKHPSHSKSTFFIFIFWGLFFIFYFAFIFISWRLITLQYCSGFCHTLTWISHGFTCVPHAGPPSYLPPHPIPLGQHS